MTNPSNKNTRALRGSLSYGASNATSPEPPATEMPPGALWRPTRHVQPMPRGKVKTAITWHWTGGLYDAPALRTLRGVGTPAKKASCHYIIGRQGTIYVLAHPDTITWHAGVTEPEHANTWSIGVEVVNPGPLFKRGGGNLYKPRFDSEDWGWGWAPDPNHRIPADPQRYGVYGEVQLAAAESLVCWLFGENGRRSVPGLEPREQYSHSELARPVGRKPDPGPLWPMERMIAAACRARGLEP